MKSEIGTDQVDSLSLLGVTFTLEVADANGLVVATAVPDSHGTTIIGDVHKAQAVIGYLSKCSENFPSDIP